LTALDAELRAELDGLRASGTFKAFREIASPQGGELELADGRRVLCLCSNDYLGLANDPAVIAAAADGLARYGLGTASVRFICGLFTPHVELERDLAEFLGTEAALTYTSCWSANQAVLDTLCDDRTWVLSDELNHASIIDGVRLARPERKIVYPHADVGELRARLAEAPTDRRLLVVTDGVFSMEGDVAPLGEIAAACRARGATLIVDDSHGLGVLGERGRGTVEHLGLPPGAIDVITGTLGKALGGAAGGFVAGSEPLCRVLEQRSRAQLFSNGLAPAVACGSRAALQRLREDPGLVAALHNRTARFRTALTAAGLAPLGDGAIVPLIVGETARAIAIGERLLERGVLATGFGYPVVPEGSARIRAQISAGLTGEQVDRAAAAVIAAVGEAGGGAAG
jgi:glycine C-acetyltransferase